MQGTAYSVIAFLLAVDPNGGFYVTSGAGPYSTEVIYRVSPNGTLQWIAGSVWPDNAADGLPATTASLSLMRGLVADGSGNLYLSDLSRRRIRKIDRNGTISTVAGAITRVGSSGDGGPAMEAGFDTPTGLAVGPEGNLYIVDQHRVRKIAPSGVISTVAGTGDFGFSGDGGPATAARLSNPTGLAVDRGGNLYISDFGNNRIRRVAADGTITTVAGGGTSTDAGSATAVALSGPSSVAVDAAGNLLFVERYRHDVRKVTPQGVITTVAGVPSRDGFAGDGGPATEAKLNTPTSVIVDGGGNLQIADSGNMRVRKVTVDGLITTIAGNGYSSFSGDGGRATQAQLLFPSGTAVDPEGNLYIADPGNGRVRRVSACGEITTVAGNGSSGFSGDGGLATAAKLGAMNGSGLALAADAAGSLYIADSYNNRVRKVTPNGFIDTIAGGSDRGDSGDGGPAKAALLFGASSLAVDLRGNLYIGGGNRVRRVTTDGIITTVAGNGQYPYQAGVGDGGAATAASFPGPDAIAVDAFGNLYIADGLNGSIRRVGLDGRISTVAGGGTMSPIPDGASATSGRLQSPSSIAIDAAGNLYIAETGTSRIRKITPAGVITTIAGNGERGFSDDGGLAASARLARPDGVALDVMGNLYFVERDTFRVRVVNGVTSPQTNFSISNRGSISLKTAGCSRTIDVGYARLQPGPGGTAPAGVAVMQFRQNNVLVSEASVPAVRPILSGRTYAEIGGRVNTGLAIVNPNAQAVTVSFYFIGEDGSPRNGSMTLAAGQQTAAFLDQPPFSVATSGRGTFSFASSLPVGVVAVRGLTNERGEFLITTLPVVDLSLAAPPGPAVAPHFAVGGGWSTEVILLNPTDSPLTGTVQFTGQSGSPATVTVNEQQGSSFGYSIGPRGAQKFKTSGPSESPQVGSARIAPLSGQTPSALVIFSYAREGITVSETGVPGVTSGTAFRLYAEAFGDFEHSVEGTLQTGVAVTNLSNAPARVDFELYLLNGLPSGVSGTLTVPANGQVARFLYQIPGFPPVVPRGVLRIVSASEIAVVGLRGRYNERVDFLTSTMPAINEAAAAPVESVFPHFADGGGYTTQFILFSGSAGQASSGDLRFFSQPGQNTNPKLR